MADGNDNECNYKDPYGGDDHGEDKPGEGGDSHGGDCDQRLTNAKPRPPGRSHSLSESPTWDSQGQSGAVGAVRGSHVKSGVVRGFWRYVTTGATTSSLLN